MAINGNHRQRTTVPGISAILLCDVDITHPKGLPLKNPTKFRQATIGDIPAMSRIRLSVQENILSNPARITEQMYADYLALLGRGWVVESNGNVVGFCYADSENSSVWALFVSPEYEGQGLARRLLNLAVDWLFEIGKESVQLSTLANTRADRFYAAQGWTRGQVEHDKEVSFRLNKATVPSIVG
jgi:GNAT superfamily N-acetyltransferase